MATTTPTLAEDLVDRWRRTTKRSSDSDSGDVIDDAIDTVQAAVVGDYWQWDDDPDFMGMGDNPPVAITWLRELQAGTRVAGQRAFEEHVVPAIVAAITETLPSAPRYLAEFPKSEQLRSDLAALRGLSRPQEEEDER